MSDSYERSNTYERVVDGQAVERVQPLQGDYEDTRLGLAVLEAEEAAARGDLGTAHWRRAGQELINAKPATPEPSTSDVAEPVTTTTPARPASRSKEK